MARVFFCGIVKRNEKRGGTYYVLGICYYGTDPKWIGTVRPYFYGFYHAGHHIPVFVCRPGVSVWVLAVIDERSPYGHVREERRYKTVKIKEDITIFRRKYNDF